MNGTLLQKPSARRVIGMVVGIVIIGLGIALFKQSHLGNDSISALNMRLAELFGISLGVQNIAANLLMFAIEIWVGRQYIGLGTFVNGICIGFIVTAFYDPIAAFFGPAASLPEQLLWVAAAVIVTALGASLYQTADLGIAPYDALALELARKGLVTDQMVLTVGYDGAELGRLSSGEQILNISAAGKYLAILTSSSLSIYDQTLQEYDVSDNTAGAASVVMRADGSAILLANGHGTLYVP